MSNAVRWRIDVALLVLLAVAVTAVLWHPVPALRTLAGCAAALFVPGAACLARVRINGWPEWIGLSVSVSLALQGMGTLVMVWTRWWNPAVLAATCGLLSAGLLLRDGWERGKELRADARTCLD